MITEANGGGMSRGDALEAVAEQLREMVTTLSNTRTNIMCAAKTDPRWEGVADLLKPRIDAARDALKDLEDADALPAAPKPARGEVVEVRAWVRESTKNPNMYIIEGCGMWDGTWRGSLPPIAVAIITARVPLPSIPTIEGTTRLAMVKGDGA